MSGRESLIFFSQTGGANRSYTRGFLRPKGVDQELQQGFLAQNREEIAEMVIFTAGLILNYFDFNGKPTYCRNEFFGRKLKT